MVKLYSRPLATTRERKVGFCYKIALLMMQADAINAMWNIKL